MALVYSDTELYTGPHIRIDSMIHSADTCVGTVTLPESLKQ
jgi:hypothetical protein